jgi:hypothetical protein
MPIQQANSSMSIAYIVTAYQLHAAYNTQMPKHMSAYLVTSLALLQQCQFSMLGPKPTAQHNQLMLLAVQSKRAPRNPGSFKEHSLCRSSAEQSATRLWSQTPQKHL